VACFNVRKCKDSVNLVYNTAVLFTRCECVIYDYRSDEVKQDDKTRFDRFVGPFVIRNIIVGRHDVGQSYELVDETTAKKLRNLLWNDRLNSAETVQHGDTDP